MSYRTNSNIDYETLDLNMYDMYEKILMLQRIQLSRESITESSPMYVVHWKIDETDRKGNGNPCTIEFIRAYFNDQSITPDSTWKKDDINYWLISA